MVRAGFAISGVEAPPRITQYGQPLVLWEGSETSEPSARPDDRALGPPFEVGRDKTDAGMREVDMLPLLREILTEHKAASAKTGAHDPVFFTAAGTPRSRHNLRQDVVGTSVAHADRLAEERGLQPLPLGITPHKLRHTFASILVAIGKDPTYVMQQLGHTEPAITLPVYAHAMRRSEDERVRLKALVGGHDWSHIGHKTPETASARLERDAA